MLIFLVSLWLFNNSVYGELSIDVYDDFAFSLKKFDWNDESKWDSIQDMYTDQGYILNKQCLRNSCYCRYKHSSPNKYGYYSVYNCVQNVFHARNNYYNQYQDNQYDDDNGFDEEETSYKLKWNYHERGSAPASILMDDTAYFDHDPTNAGVTGECPVAISVNHIISKSKLIEFWDEILTNGKLSELFPLLKEMKTKLAYIRLNGVPGWNPNVKNQGEMSAVETAIDNIVNGGITHNDASGRITYTFGVRTYDVWYIAQKIFEWMEGNLFLGPSDQSRKVPAGAGFETDSKKIISKGHFDALEYINGEIIKYLDPALRDTVDLKVVTTKLAYWGLGNVHGARHIKPFDPDQWIPDDTGAGPVTAHVWKYKITGTRRRTIRRLLTNNLKFGAYDRARPYKSWQTEAHFNGKRYCIIPLARHHVIPVRKLIEFWNKVAVAGDIRDLDTLLAALSAAAHAAGDDNARDWIEDLRLGNNDHANGGVALDNGNKPRHDFFRHLYLWEKGNIFIGPTESIRDAPAGDNLDTRAKRMFRTGNGADIPYDYTLYDNLEEAYNKMNTYIGNPLNKADLGRIATLLTGFAQGNFKPFVQSDWEINNHKWKIKDP